MNFREDPFIVSATDPGFALQVPPEHIPNQQIPHVSWACPTGSSPL
jgi:hypothetical protein